MTPRARGDADVGYGITGPGGRGSWTPYAGLTRSAAGHRTMRFSWRWKVGPRLNISLESARQGGFGTLPSLDAVGDGMGLDQLDGGATSRSSHPGRSGPGRSAATAAAHRAGASRFQPYQPGGPRPSTSGVDTGGDR